MRRMAFSSSGLMSYYSKRQPRPGVCYYMYVSYVYHGEPSWLSSWKPIVLPPPAFVPKMLLEAGDPVCPNSTPGCHDHDRDFDWRKRIQERGVFKPCVKCGVHTEFRCPEDETLEMRAIVAEVNALYPKSQKISLEDVRAFKPVVYNAQRDARVLALAKFTAFMARNWTPFWWGAVISGVVNYALRHMLG